MVATATRSNYWIKFGNFNLKRLFFFNSLLREITKKKVTPVAQRLSRFEISLFFFGLIMANAFGNNFVC